MRVIIAEDSVLLRQGLTRLLEDSGVSIVAQLGDTSTLLERVKSARPDVVILDIRMPPTHSNEGVLAAEAIHRQVPETAVLLLSQYVDTSSTVRALTRTGSRFGYLLKENVTDAEELYDALKRLADGQCVIDRKLVARLMRRPRMTGPLDALTPRERQVLALMAEGRSNEAITEHLTISGKTLESHIRSIFAKLHLEPNLSDHRRVLAVLAYLQT